jgi:hypothetical protein
MPNLKLGRLPDRTPVKICFRASPDLARSLRAYAELYRETYGRVEAVSDLIPRMLEIFLASDRAFVHACKEGRISPDVSETQNSGRPRGSDSMDRRLARDDESERAS